MNETDSVKSEFDDEAAAERREALEAGLKSSPTYFLCYITQVLASSWYRIMDIQQKLRDGSEEEAEKADESLHILCETNYWLIDRLVEELMEREAIPREPRH